MNNLKLKHSDLAAQAFSDEFEYTPPVNGKASISNIIGQSIPNGGANLENKRKRGRPPKNKGSEEGLREITKSISNDSNERRRIDLCSEESGRLKITQANQVNQVNQVNKVSSPTSAKSPRINRISPNISNNIGYQNVVNVVKVNMQDVFINMVPCIKTCDYSDLLSEDQLKIFKNYLGNMDKIYTDRESNNHIKLKQLILNKMSHHIMGELLAQYILDSGELKGISGTKEMNKSSSFVDLSISNGVVSENYISKMPIANKNKTKKKPCVKPVPDEKSNSNANVHVENLIESSMDIDLDYEIPKKNPNNYGLSKKEYENLKNSGSKLLSLVEPSKKVEKEKGKEIITPIHLYIESEKNSMMKQSEVKEKAVNNNNNNNNVPKKESISKEAYIVDASKSKNIGNNSSITSSSNTNNKPPVINDQESMNINVGSYQSPHMQMMPPHINNIRSTFNPMIRGMYNPYMPNPYMPIAPMNPMVYYPYNQMYTPHMMNMNLASSHYIPPKDNKESSFVSGANSTPEVNNENANLPSQKETEPERQNSHTNSSEKKMLNQKRKRSNPKEMTEKSTDTEIEAPKIVNQNTAYTPQKKEIKNMKNVQSGKKESKLSSKEKESKKSQSKEDGTQNTETAVKENKTQSQTDSHPQPEKNKDVSKEINPLMGKDSTSNTNSNTNSNSNNTANKDIFDEIYKNLDNPLTTPFFSNNTMDLDFLNMYSFNSPEHGNIEREPIQFSLKPKKVNISNNDGLNYEDGNKDSLNDESNANVSNTLNNNEKDNAKTQSGSEIQTPLNAMNFKNMDKMVQIISTYDSDFIKFSQLREYLPENTFKEIDFCLNNAHEEEFQKKIFLCEHEDYNYYFNFNSGEKDYKWIIVKSKKKSK